MFEYQLTRRNFASPKDRTSQLNEPTGRTNYLDHEQILCYINITNCQITRTSMQTFWQLGFIWKSINNYVFIYHCILAKYLEHFSSIGKNPAYISEILFERAWKWTNFFCCFSTKQVLVKEGLFMTLLLCNKLTKKTHLYIYRWNGIKHASFIIIMSNIWS